MGFKTNGRRTWLEDEDGNEVASLNHPQMVARVVNFLSIEVDDELKGQGIGDKMMQLVADKLRKDGFKAVLSCPYSIQWFDEHPEYQDVLENPALEAAKALKYAAMRNDL